MSTRQTARDRYDAAMAMAERYRNHQHGRKTMPERVKFPEVSDRDDRITEVREAMAEAYDAAETELQRRRRMDAPREDLAKRFTALRGGG